MTSGCLEAATAGDVPGPGVASEPPPPADPGWSRQLLREPTAERADLLASFLGFFVPLIAHTHNGAVDESHLERQIA